DARLCGADLRNARLGGASLTRTSFKGADLRNAYLRVAKFDHVDLSGADLRGVRGLTREQIDNAICDADTRLPDDLSTETTDGA
ncbi:MAG: pentapeptide repeat-containing protein, partial [Alphaproteobacteria bacterium]|nr:pentapeptide repeat-containing protein [Alphaproteobacteria bacterium]